MSFAHPFRSRICFWFGGALLLMMLGCQTMSSDNTSGNGSTTGTGGNTANKPRFLVWNNGAVVDSYATAEAVSGDLTPATSLSNAQYQPLAVAVTKSGKMIEINEPAIYIYDNALTATGNTAPS